MSETGFDDGLATPDEIYTRLYPSTDVYGVEPEMADLSTVDNDPDDIGGMPVPQATDDPHRDLPNISDQDVDPDDL